jgi:predicted DNA-binding transcriptional regulator AlpA
LNSTAPSISTILTEIQQLRAELKATSSKMLTVEQAAAYLGVSAKTIRNGLGPRAAKAFPVRPVKVSGRVLFRRSDLDNYVDSL